MQLGTMLRAGLGLFARGALLRAGLFDRGDELALAREVRGAARRLCFFGQTLLQRPRLLQEAFGRKTLLSGVALCLVQCLDDAFFLFALQVFHGPIEPDWTVVPALPERGRTINLT